MRRIEIIDTPRQSFSAVLNGRRCTIDLSYNVLAARWMMDLSIDSTLELQGRRVVVGVDLLAPFDFSIGAIFAGDFEGAGAEPDYDGLVSGRVRLFQAAYDEVASLI